MEISSIIMRGNIQAKITIGAPVKQGNTIIGDVVSAEVMTDYIEMTAQLNEKGKDLFNKIKETEHLEFECEYVVPQEKK